MSSDRTQLRAELEALESSSQRIEEHTEQLQELRSRYEDRELQWEAYECSNLIAAASRRLETIAAVLTAARAELEEEQ